MRPIRPTLTGAALALALATGAGVITTASPASADTFGRFTMSAKGHIVDEDSPDADDICDKSTTNVVSTATNEDFTAPDIVWQCDEIKVQLSAHGHVNDDGTVHYFFNRSFWWRECWVGSCFWALADSVTLERDNLAGQSRTFSNISFTKSGTMRVTLPTVMFWNQI